MGLRTHTALQIKLNIFSCQRWYFSYKRRTETETEPEHDKTKQNDLCAKQRLRSACAAAQSDESSLCTLWIAKDLSLYKQLIKD